MALPEIHLPRNALQAFATAAHALVDECRIRVIPQEGIFATDFVDPAHVAMGHVRLIYLPHEADACELGMDVEKLKERLEKFERVPPLQVRFVSQGEKGITRLQLQQGGITRNLATVDLTGLLVPKAVQVELPSVGSVRGKDLLKALNVANEVSDHAFFRVKDGVLSIHAVSNGNEDDVDVIRLDSVAPFSADALSIFSLDYLRRIVKALESVDETVTLHLGVNYPCRLESSGDNVYASFLMAPRIDPVDASGVVRPPE